MGKRSAAARYSLYALNLLLAINLLNYIDRQVLYAVFPLIKEDLQLSDTALGLLGSAFMLVYMCSAPVLGWLGDRVNRVKVASFGLLTWSIATAVSGFAAGYRQLIVARAAVGIGEASFGTVSPGLIAGYFEKGKRGRVLSYFYLAIPVGSALGYLLGGVLGSAYGWKTAFLLVGVPGLILFIPTLFLHESRDAGKIERDLAPSSGKTFRAIFNRSFIINTLSMAAMTFALGGLAQWVPSFLHRIHGVDVARGNTIFGIATVIAGIAGTSAGGWLGDRLQKETGKGYPLVSALGFLAGAPIAAYALLTASFSACIAAIFFSEFFLFLNTGPLNTIIVNVTPPGLRATAFAVNIFFIHALGDAISPALLGRLSDLWGLRNALLITPFAILVASFFSFVCSRLIEKDSLH